MESKILDKKRLPITSLHEFQGDFKTLGKKQFEKLKKSIEKNGFIQPFFIWNKDGKYFILDGHQRKKAIIDLYGDTIDVDCLEIKADSELEAKKFVLYYSTSYAEFDKDSFFNFAEGLNFDDLEAFQFPGFSFSENDFLKDLNNEQDDEIPEVAQNECGVELGDIYTLGDHRLMCGDSTDLETVQMLMDGQKADMVFTDPPYGVSYTGGLQDKGKGLQGGSRKMIKNDGIDLYESAVSIASILCTGPIFMFYADTVPFGLYRGIQKVNGEIVALLIWKKIGGYGALNASYKPNHEPCVIWKNKGAKLNFIGSTTENRIWEEKKDGVNLLHPTQKPVSISERAIKNHKADYILDLFGGSGSTLIACEKTKRKCYMMELDPHYCSVIIKRWEKFTGQKAVKCE